MIIQISRNSQMPFYCKNEEEMQLSLQCANKIKSHLDRLIEGEAKVKFVNNRDILNRMIRSFQVSLQSKNPRLKASLS